MYALQTHHAFMVLFLAAASSACFLGSTLRSSMFCVWIHKRYYSGAEITLSVLASLLSACQALLSTLDR